MEDVEHGEYVAQLKAEFDACDSSASGFLDRDGLTKLCGKLHLDAHLHPMLDTLLPLPDTARVNFEEFKDGFVAVLSKTLDLSSSDDSSYLQPVVPEEMKPKFMKGLKRYGRRSRPDRPNDDPDLGRSTEGLRGAKLQRTTSLDSIESLKSDEEPPRVMEDAVPQCEHGGTLLSQAQLWWRLRRLEADVRGRVSLRDVHRVLCSPAPLSSTPARTLQEQSREQRDFSPPASPMLSPLHSQGEGAEECSFGPTPLLAVGRRLLSCLDDGSGAVSPDQVLSLWREEGLQDSQQVLQMLDFSLDERLSLSDLTVALDNELLVSANSVHQAALISYKMELQHIQTVLEAALRERDKAKSDLDQSNLRNLQLIRESEERQNIVETSAAIRVRDAEASCRARLSAVRAQMEQEMDLVHLQMERERSVHQEALKELTARESNQQGELCALRQENLSLEQELMTVKISLRESQSSVDKLHQDLDRLLLDKFSLDPSDGELSHEERFSEIIREYELQYRELRDRNDELSSELELVKSQRPERRPNRELNQDETPDLGAQDQELNQEQTSDYDEAEVRSPRLRRKLVPLDKTALVSLDSGVDSVSIQTELALEQLREKHQEEIHQLNVKLETQVNYYERSLEQMRSSVELERKDISQAFKMEICELEEQKSELETQLKQLKDNMERNQQKQAEQRSREQEKRLQRERAEMEQNFAREISNLVQRLSAEKDQLEAELRLKNDQELLLVRSDTEQRASWENHLSNQEKEIMDLQRALLQSERSLEQVSAQLHKSEKSSETLQRLQTTMEEEISELQKERDVLETSLQDVTEKFRQSEEEIRRLQDVLNQLEMSLETLKRLQTTMEDEILELQNQHNQSKMSLRVTTEKFSQSESSLQEMTIQFNQSEMQRETLQKLQTKMEAEILELQKQRNESDMSLNKSQEEVARLRLVLSQSETSVGTLQRLQTKMGDEILELQKQRNDLESTLRDANQELKEFREEVVRLGQVLGQSQQSLERAQEYAEHLEEELRSWRRRGSELEAQLEEACSQLMESVAFLESHEILNRRLTQEKVQAEAELQRVQDELLENIQRRRKCPAMEEDEEVVMLRRDRNRLIQDLKEQAMAVDTLRLELEEERTKRKNTKEELWRVSELEMTVDQLKMEILEWKAIEDQLKEAVQDERRKHLELEGLCLKLQEEIKWRDWDQEERQGTVGLNSGSEEVQRTISEREKLVDQLKMDILERRAIEDQLREAVEEERRKNSELKGVCLKLQKNVSLKLSLEEARRIHELEMSVDQLNMEVSKRNIEMKLQKVQEQELPFSLDNIAKDLTSEERKHEEEALLQVVINQLDSSLGHTLKGTLDKSDNVQKSLNVEKGQEEMEFLSVEKLSDVMDVLEQKEAVPSIKNFLDMEKDQELRVPELLETVSCLSSEKATYMRLCDQLSTQIVDMEEEIRALQALLGELSSRLNHTADLVLELRVDRSERLREVEKIREECDGMKVESEQKHKEIQRLRTEMADREHKHEELQQLKVEMRRERDQKEAEITKLRAEVAESAWLKEQSDKKEAEIQRLREERRENQVEVARLEAESAWLKESEWRHSEELRQLRAASAERLNHMEVLVRRLEQVDGDIYRTQMEEVRSENGALQERLTLLQQEVAALEEEVSVKRCSLAVVADLNLAGHAADLTRMCGNHVNVNAENLRRKLEETQRERERERDEQETLHRENADLRGQILDLSRRNLELSDTNADLSSKIRGDQESLVVMRDRLKIMTQEQEEHSATVQRLKEELVQSERDKQQRLNSVNQDKHLLQTELTSNKTKVAQLLELEAELQSLRLKLQWSQDEKKQLKRDHDIRTRQVEDLGKSLKSVEMEAESLRAQIQSTNQEALSSKQEVMQTQRRLQDTHNKVEELESSLRKVITEKEDVTSSLEAELHQLRVKNQEQDDKIREGQAQNQQIQKLNQQQQELRTQVDQLETAKNQAQDQALRADTALSLVQAQHLRQIQQFQESQSQSQSETKSREELESALRQLREERERRERLEEELRETHTTVNQVTYDQAVSVLQTRAEDLETQLKATRSLLQEKVTELQDQVSKSVHSGTLVQRLYLENSELQGALQVTEQRQRAAQKKSQVLESKVQALNRLLRQLVPQDLN